MENTSSKSSLILVAPVDWEVVSFEDNEYILCSRSGAYRISAKVRLVPYSGSEGALRGVFYNRINSTATVIDFRNYDFIHENVKWIVDSYVCADTSEVYRSLYYAVLDDCYLVVEMMEGEMLSQTFQKWTKKQTIEFYANLLKSIHSLDINNFPFNHDLDYRLNKIVVSEAKTQYFERELKGKDPQEMYDFIQKNKHFEKDLVVCHGDVCFPNFMMKNDELAALIDVSGAGIEDRYLDIAIALRTLRYNFEMIQDNLTNEDISYFCMCYGLEKLDEFKLKYYIYLDELTNG